MHSRACSLENRSPGRRRHGTAFVKHLKRFFSPMNKSRNPNFAEQLMMSSQGGHHKETMEDSTDDEDESPMIAAEETPVIERDECPRDVSVFETEVMEEEREAPDPPRPPGMMENGKFDCDSSDENSGNSSTADRRLRPLRMGYRSRPLRIQSSSSESEESVDDRMHPPNCACQQGPSNGWRWSWNLGGYWDHYKIEAPDPPPGRPSGSTAADTFDGPEVNLG